MAHSCPECGETCYCNGDIDDILLDADEDVNACNHWKQCEKDDDDDYFEDEDDRSMRETGFC